MENKNVKMIRDYMNLMESVEKNIISESIIAPLLTQSFKGFSKAVSLAVENSIKKVLDDVVLKSVGKSVAMSTIKNNQSWKQAVIQSVEEAARARHKMPFAELSKKLPNEADKLVSEVDTILKKELDNAANAQGKAISKDVTSSKNVLDKTQTAKAAGTATKEDLSLATKNWDKNVKLQTKIKDAKRVLAGMPATTRKEVDKILKLAKTTKTTGSQISTGVKTGGKKTVQLPVSSGGGLFKATKDQLAKLPGSIVKVVVSKGIVKSLVILGVSVGVIYLIYQSLFPNDSIIIEDENGNDVDFGGNEFAPCVQNLINNKSASLTSEVGGAISALVTKTGNEEYDKVGGLRFYMDGRVVMGDNSKTGKWTCKDGEAVINEMYLNEQSTNVADDVETMIDLLDFPVTGSDLSSAKDLLQKYTTNGQGKEFLNLYQKTGLVGGSLKKSLDYIVTINAGSVQSKETMYGLINKINSDAPTNTGGGIGDINITWDGEKTVVPEPPKKEEKKKTVYTDRDKFPYRFGDKGPIIKEVQICFGFEQ
jgi:hypothetical protein